MPGIRADGQHNTDDYSLGRGKVYFAELDSNDLPKGYRDLGNATEFMISVEKEELDHYSSRSGLKKVDKQVVVSQKVSLSLTLDEINFDNLALFMSGTSAERDNEGDSGVTGSSNVTVVTQGRWYDLYDEAAGPDADTESQGNRIYDIGDVTVTPAAGGSALVEGTDFNVDKELGRIFVIDGGDMEAGNYDVDIAANASSTEKVHVVKALAHSGLVGALKFVSENPADGDKWTEYQFHQVRLTAEGDLSLIGDEWTTLPLSGAAESNEAADADSPTLTITTNPNQS